MDLFDILYNLTFFSKSNFHEIFDNYLIFSRRFLNLPFSVCLILFEVSQPSLDSLWHFLDIIFHLFDILSFLTISFQFHSFDWPFYEIMLIKLIYAFWRFSKNFWHFVDIIATFSSPSSNYLQLFSTFSDIICYLIFFDTFWDSLQFDIFSRSSNFHELFWRLCLMTFPETISRILLISLHVLDILLNF